MLFDIIIPTMKTYEEFVTTHFYTCLQKLENSTEHTVSIHIKYENKQGLSELYQDHLNLLKSSDYVVFIHDDLEIHDQFLFEKLIKAHEQFNIVGLAGAISQDYTDIYLNSGQELPIVWHLRKIKPEHSRGIVSHAIPKGFNNCEQSHINSAYYGPTPSPVCVIDGLFMSFKTSTLIDKDEVFDRDFTFHFYDLAMCVRASMMGLSMGVYPIFGIHHGLGEFDNDPTWHKMAKKFKEKYINYKVII
jgi:GT2 family glycosyltransferase